MVAMTLILVEGVILQSEQTITFFKGQHWRHRLSSDISSLPAQLQISKCRALVCTLSESLHANYERYAADDANHSNNGEDFLNPVGIAEYAVEVQVITMTEVGVTIFKPYPEPCT